MVKNKKFAAKIGALALAAAMCLGSSVTAFAAGSNYGTNIGGVKTTTFNSYLVIDQTAEVPNAAFTYEVTAGVAKTYTAEGKSFEILAGVDADKVTMAGVGTTAAKTIQFAQGDESKTDDNAHVKNYDKTTQKYVEKAATLDFSACAFTEPGIYRYIVTESGTNQGITNDADLTRVIDVYVEDASTEAAKALEVKGFVLHSNEDGSPDSPNAKGTGFTNGYDTVNLTFRKEVNGNQASRDKYFEFTVAIANATAGTKYPVDLSKADATSGTNAATIAANAGQANAAEITVGDDGTATQKFYLQHGQEIKIHGLAAGTTYNVTENAEDYTSTAAGVTGFADAVSGTIADADINTSYLNERNGVIPTGVVMAVAPFAAIALIGAGGVIGLSMKKKKDED